MADHTPLDLDALEAALATAAAKPWRVSDGGIDAIVSLRNTALALIARLRAAEAAACKYASEAHDAEMDAQIKREQLAAAREAHAKALAHALRPLEISEGALGINNLLAARLAAAKETTT